MAKTRRSEDGTTLFWCPGCDHVHAVSDSWIITGTPDNPTFDPSVMVLPSGNVKRCHSFVSNGMIVFLGDCEHRLAGQTVPLPEIDAKFAEES